MSALDNVMFADGLRRLARSPTARDGDQERLGAWASGHRLENKRHEIPLGGHSSGWRSPGRIINQPALLLSRRTRLRLDSHNHPGSAGHLP